MRALTFRPVFEEVDLRVPARRADTHVLLELKDERGVTVATTTVACTEEPHGLFAVEARVRCEVTVPGGLAVQSWCHWPGKHVVKVPLSPVHVPSSSDGTLSLDFSAAGRCLVSIA